MNRNKILGIIVVFIVITTSSAIFSTGCYKDDNEARVTIHLERNDLAVNGTIPQKHIIDRILEFFSTPAVATSGWDATPRALTLVVTNPSIEKLTFSIPQNATSYNVIVPVADSMKFELFSTTINNAVPKNWGGEIISNLHPGDNNITIAMLPMTKISGAGGSTTLTVTWEAITAYVSSYKIYRSNNINGPYLLIGTQTTAQSTYNDNSAISATIYFYKVSIVYLGREGSLCDAVSGSR